MTIEEKLKKLITDRYGSMREFCNVTGMTTSTLSTILSRGIHKANIGSVIKICKALGISADALAQDVIAPINEDTKYAFVLTEMDEIVKFQRLNIDRYQEITVGGEPISEDDAAMIIDAVEFAVELIKKKRKRKK